MRKSDGIQERTKSQKFAAAGGIGAMLKQQASRRQFGVNADPTPWKKKGTEEGEAAADDDEYQSGDEMSF